MCLRRGLRPIERIEPTSNLSAASEPSHDVQINLVGGGCCVGARCPCDDRSIGNNGGTSVLSSPGRFHLLEFIIPGKQYVTQIHLLHVSPGRNPRLSACGHSSSDLP